jgi:nucleotide-binding universal stress UspA family protein
VRDDVRATLVAVGGRRSSRFLGIMLGDTTTELLHDGVCSMLVARPRPGGTWQPGTVVVGADGSPSALLALDEAESLAERLGGAVEVVVATGGEPSGEEGAWTEKVSSWEPTHPVAALVEHSRLADLVVVGSRGLHGVHALGSVSERVAHQAHCSVLVVHAESAAGA